MSAIIKKFEHPLQIPHPVIPIMETMTLQSGHRLQLPTDWGEVTVQHHIECRKALESKGGKDYILMLLLSAVSGLPVSTIRAMTKEEADRAIKPISFLFKTDIPIPSDPLNEFTHDGIAYQVPTDILKRTFGEFVDYDQTLTSLANSGHPGSQAEAVLESLAVYCRPKDQPYWPDADTGQQELDKRREAFKTLPITTGEGVAAFFTRAGWRQEQAIRLFGAAATEVAASAQTWRHSPANGVGLRSLTRWPRVIALRLLQSQADRLVKSSCGLPSKTKGPWRNKRTAN